MAEEKFVCLSCKKRITNTLGTTRFKCPNCAKSEIIRCRHCREIVAKYKCALCNFEGPN
ncbi:RNA-binding protein [Candidatus Woesearchaeota archaeon]|nr:RNA-binding protein [Candidatus Woesearchaeota archaeon]